MSLCLEVPLRHQSRTTELTVGGRCILSLVSCIWCGQKLKGSGLRLKWEEREREEQRLPSQSPLICPHERGEPAFHQQSALIKQEETLGKGESESPFKYVIT